MRWPVEGLSAILSRHFGPVTIADEPVAEVLGINGGIRGTHYVATGTDGRVFSIKKPVEKPEFFRHEKLGGELAILVAAPNACRMAVDTLDSTYPESLRGDVILIERMIGDVHSLRERVLVAPDMQAHDEHFLEQAGEWMTFCEALCLWDRNSSNILWDMRDHRLLHIDFEELLDIEREDAIGLTSLRLLGLVGFTQDEWKTQPPNARVAALERGIAKMDTKLRQHAREIQERIVAAGGQHAITNVMEWIGYSKERKILYFRDFLLT